MPGFSGLEEELAGGSGDWTVRLIDGKIEAIAAANGKPYFAKVVGRDQTYGWKREFLKAKWEYPSRFMNPTGNVRLIVQVRTFEKLPVALDIRWGPATGSQFYDQNTGKGGRYCAMRGLFILDSAGFRQVEERHVAWLLDERIAAPGPPRRPPDMRAKTIFDDDV